MKRYWFEFEVTNVRYDLALGCGVTAYNHADALHLLEDLVFKEKAIPIPKKTIEDVDISTLDARHVLLNMGPPNMRGVWYPLGYSW
ncbi:hypothetical protein [Mucilaginibacter pineti]|nr:hypothetical protein [Mucilaginibacter pineti]